MSETDAAKRAAARRAKILARGNTGLQKLAQTARGDEAEKLYGGDSASSSRPGTPSAASPTSPSATSGSTGPSWVPPNTGSTGSGRSTTNRPGTSQSAMSPEQQQMQDQFQAMMSMLGGGPAGAAGAGGDGGGGGMPDMSSFFAQMMGQTGPGGGGAGGGMGRNLLGDLDDPAGLGGRPGSDPSAFGGAGGGGPDGMPNFPDLSQLANFGMGGGGGLGGDAFGPQKGKSWVEKVYPFVHVLSIFALLAFVVGWWEPSIRAARGWQVVTGGSAFERWARMIGKRFGGIGLSGGFAGLGSVERLPLFWAFTTLELILFTTRFILLKSPPPPHSLISTFLPMLPPGIARPLVTGSRYLTMASQIYKDGCLLIFGLGLFVIVAQYVS